MQPPIVHPSTQYTKVTTHLRSASLSEWHLGTRILFRFCFVYFILFIFPFPLNPSFKPFTSDDVPPDGLKLLWDRVVPPVATMLFHRPVGDLEFGDTVYGYTRTAIFVVIAILATGIWSMWQRKCTNHRKMYAWLRMYVRLTLGASMLAYGIVKLFPIQFRDSVPLSRLLQPFGDASPMGLLWTFMDYSRPYQVFAGILEAVGGLLLFVPSTTTAGALLCLAAMSNVVVLDFSYDVFVRLYAIHLLLMSIFLIAPDARVLWNLLILRCPSMPAAEPALFQRKSLVHLLLAIQLGLCAYAVARTYIDARQGVAAHIAKTPRLHGIWVVQEFALNGQDRPPLMTDDQRWLYVVFDQPSNDALGADFAVLTNRSRHMFWSRYDEGQLKLLLTRAQFGNCSLDLLSAGTTEKCAGAASLTARRPAEDLIVLDGEFEGQQLHATIHRVTMKFTLTSTPFNWGYGLGNR